MGANGGACGASALRALRAHFLRAARAFFLFFLSFSVRSKYQKIAPFGSHVCAETTGPLRRVPPHAPRSRAQQILSGSCGRNERPGRADQVSTVDYAVDLLWTGRLPKRSPALPKNNVTSEVDALERAANRSCKAASYYRTELVIFSHGLWPSSRRRAGARRRAAGAPTMRSADPMPPPSHHACVLAAGRGFAQRRRREMPVTYAPMDFWHVVFARTGSAIPKIFPRACGVTLLGAAARPYVDHRCVAAGRCVGLGLTASLRREEAAAPRAR